MEEANLYQAPEASIRQPVENVRRSIWAPVRWLPAAWCVMMAGVGIIMAVLVPGMNVLLLIRYGLGPFELASQHPSWMIAKILSTALIAGTGAAISLSGARAWMRRRWKWAIVATILSYPILLAAANLMMNTNSPGLPSRP